MQIFLVVLRAASLLALIFSVFLSLVKLMGQKDMDCATFRTLSASASILTISERGSPRIHSWEEREREYFGEKRVLNEQMSIEMF